MSLSIVSPHFNDLKGLQDVYACLIEQTNTEWEWLIIDDCSDQEEKLKLENWYRSISNDKVDLILNAKKSNASVCRNLGAKKARFSHLVFLDSDDVITKTFVSNRQIKFTDFAVLKNTGIINKNRDVQESIHSHGEYLDHFLKAHFIWPITAILWNKSFFINVGMFHPELPRLQDVEMSIRALQHSSDYSVLENEIDFYYKVKPIRERTNFVKPVSFAVNLFISELLNTTGLSKKQLSLLKGYYFMNVKYLERSESREHINLVHKNLILFYKKRYINVIQFTIGKIALNLYKSKIISGQLFLRINRYFFKPKN